MKNRIFIKPLAVSCFCLLSEFSVLAETYEVGSGTITASDEFVFKHTGTKDSFAGTLTRESDGFTLYFDIGKMAGTHMHDGKKDQCTYFRKHSIGGLPAITGIEAIPDGKRIVTTVAYDPKTDRDPANFWFTIHKDTDIADFLLIAATYQAKPPATDRPESSQVPDPETGAKDSILDGNKIYSGDTRIGLNGDVHLDLEAAKKSGEAKAAKDIKAGTFRILEYGEPRQITNDTKDPQTGFRVQSVAGCKVTKTLLAEADAYNQAMREWHVKTKVKDVPVDAGFTKRVVEILTDCKRITAGTTREELLKTFTTEGGIYTPAQRHFVHRRCPLVKVDVSFTLMDANQTSEQPNDIVREISKPYLQETIGD